MAFFKLRRAAGEQPALAPAPESVDALRKRARYRLAGAAILVLAGVVGFPLLFDNQPRPIAVDIPIDIPDKAKVKPLVVAPVSDAKPGVAAAPAEPVASVPVTAVPEVAISHAASGPVALPKPVAIPVPVQAEEKPVAKPEAKAEPKPAEKKSDKPADSAGRCVVQFGAFTDAAHAREARLKVEKTGLKTYAQIAETPEGKKFRVRVGPYEKRSDAEKAAEKIKMIGLPVAILGL